MTWLVLVILTLLLGFYVAAEFAAVSVRASRIRQQADEGSGLARRLLPILSDAHRLDHYIAASQIGITLCSLVAGAYAQSALTPVLAPLFAGLGGLAQPAAISASTITILVVLTVIQMVIGELVPKSLALQYPTRVALWTVVPMIWSARALSWFITLLNGSGGLVLRALRVPPAGHGHVHSPEEIEYLIAESGKGGVFKPNEQVRLRHALQLGQRTARELMVPRNHIVAGDVECGYAELVRIAIESPYTRIPIYEGSIDNIIGVVHVRDVAAAAPSAGGTAPSPRTLMRPALALPQAIRADRVLSRLREERRTMAILVDEFGGTAGLITVDDVLDELIGDIGDEFRAPEPVPERLPDGRVRLPGSLPVSDAAQWTGARWSSTYSTVGGMVMGLLPSAPAAGATVVVRGVVVEVEVVEGRAIRSLLVTPVRDGEDGHE